LFLENTNGEAGFAQRYQVAANADLETKRGIAQNPGVMGLRRGFNPLGNQGRIALAKILAELPFTSYIKSWQKRKPRSKGWARASNRAVCAKGHVLVE